MADRIKYRSGFKYQLAEGYSIKTAIRQISRIETEFIELDETGGLVIHGGYAWDGPSGPTIDTKNAMRGSLVHDALYQLMRMGLLDRGHRGTADDEFRRICREDGMSWFRAWYFHIGVDSFAAGAVSAKARKKVIIAP